MPMRALVLCSLVAVPLLMAPVVSVAGGKLYRYHDSNGVLVINHTLPAVYAAQGYEILDQRGRVLEVVAPPQPLAEGEHGEADRIQGGDPEALDRMLRTSYSSVAQIEEARDRRLSQIERQIDLVNTTLAQTGTAIQRERQRAARFERAGEAVPESVTDNLAKLRTQRESTAHSLRIREEELNVVRRQYAGYVERFRALTAEED